MNKLLDEAAKLPLAVKAVVLVIILVGIGWYEYQVNVDPYNTRMAKIRKEAADLQVRIAENKAVADSYGKFQEEVNVLNEQLKQAVSLLPNEADVQGIYRQLSILSKKANVDLLYYRPGGTTSRGFYSELAMDLRLDGTYHDIAAFIDQVGKLSRIINIGDIVFSNARGSAGGTVLTVDCHAVTYMFVGRS